MNKNTIHSIKNIFFLKIFFAVILLCTNSVHSQVVQKGVLHIKDNSFLYLKGGASSFTFGTTPATTSTTRTVNTYGKLSFASGISLIGVGTGHFVDGFAKTYSTIPFTFPIGDNGSYRPATVSSISGNTTGIDAAYSEANPKTGIGSIFTSPISDISTVEFWEINSASASAVIELTWNAASDINTLTGSNLPYLSIVGWDGAKWVEIPSSLVLGSTMSSGSIKSDAPVVLAYEAYTFGVVAPLSACLDIFDSTGSKTYEITGWSGGTPPTLFDDVTINAPYAAGSFACNSLILNADVTLGSNDGIEVVKGITAGTAGKKIIMANTSSIVQRANILPGPPIDLTLRTRSLRRNDYTYFGTPIAGDFFPQLAGAHSTTLMPLVNNALDGFYKWIPGDGATWQNTSAITGEGYGFIAKIANKAPFSSMSVFDRVSFVLNGFANNGNVDVNVVKSTNTDDEYEGNYNLLGNPYPSAIYADLFLEENLNIDGVVYIWNAANQSTDGTTSYDQADYMAYTRLGSTYTAPTNITQTFNGNIASGQGFMVKAVNTGTVTFTNCMRLIPPSSNTSFSKTTKGAKTAAVKPKIDRFKLTLTNTTDVYSQILIGYLPNCTNQYDRMYDASRNSVSTTQLFSLLDDNQQLAINARPSFSVTDVVPLGVTKTNTLSEDYTISISEKEGVFEGTSVKVYLYDKLFNLYHNFENGDYNFSTNSDKLLDRFSVVYSDATLSNPDFDKSRFTAYIKNEVLYLNSSNEMSSSEVYDLTGRLIDSFNVNDVLNYTRKFNHAEAVYIIKVQFLNGTIAEQKIINNNNK